MNLPVRISIQINYMKNLMGIFCISSFGINIVIEKRIAESIIQLSFLYTTYVYFLKYSDESFGYILLEVVNTLPDNDAFKYTFEAPRPPIQIASAE